MGKLSDKAVQAAATKNKQYGISDGDGLTLIVKTTGSKLWWLRYRFGGKAKTLSFGEYPLVSLKEAREKAFFAKKTLLDGRDPSAAKIAAKKEIIKIQEEEKASLATTFESVAREWFGKFSKSNNWAENHSSKILGRLEKDIFPWLGDKQIGEIEPKELLTVIRRIENRGALETAHRALSECGRVFRYAVASGLAKRDPVGCVIPHGIAGIDGMLSKRQKKNDWCISYDEKVTVPGRINFTTAHELGHYLLHRKLRDSFQCGQVQMLEYDSPESRRIESQANTFASYLLMPRNDFEAQIAGHELSFELLGHCANRYETSLTATALKWLEFTNEAAMMVVADHDDFICWSYCSQAARRIGAYKSPGEVVPASVLEYMRSNALDVREPRRVAPTVWHATEEAIESVIVSDQFEQNIFLIRFPHALLIDHAEEPESDAFTVFEENGQGLNWKK